MQPEKQETEIRETNTQAGDTSVKKQAVVRDTQTSGLVIIQRLIWFIVGLICAIVALRFFFLLLGASREAAFTDFIYSVSAPLVAPFVGIFGEPTYGQAVFELSSILAIVIYLLIGIGITKLITIPRPQDEV